MEPTEPMTIRASRRTIAELDAIAAQMDRSRNYIVKQAIEEYLAYHQVLRQKIEKGLAEAKAGKVMPAADFMKELRSQRARRRRK